MKTEGGNWSRHETERLALFESALPRVSAVDIELKSKLVESVAKAARRHKKACIVSFHDFEKTPPRRTLENIVRKAQRLGSIVKISTKINGNEDARTLAGLLLGKWKTPLCVIGMGSAGSHTRVSFPLLGSCLAYAFLEKPAAPGQLSAARLVDYLTELLPEYGAQRRAKRP
jgi:3-dehydroquinate dehydratase-1